MTATSTAGRGRGRGAGFRAAIAAVTFVAVLQAPALAQRSEVRPSLTLAMGYDENPVLQPDGTPDLVFRFTPGLTARRETARTRWIATFDLDAQRHREHAALTSPLARQHGEVRGRFIVGPRATFEIGGGYDRTLTPTDLNLETALAVEPIRATRLAGRTAMTWAIDPLTTLDTSLELVDDSLSSDVGLRTYELEVGIIRQVGRRNELAWTYRGRRLSHTGLPTAPDTGLPGAREAAATPTSLSHAAILSWTHRLTPATSLTVGAGPRLDDDSVRTDIELAMVRRATRGWDAELSYVRTQAPALGVREFVALERVLAAATYRSVGQVETTIRAGIYRNELSTATVQVFRVAGGVTTPITPMVSFLVSYGVEWQDGRPVVPRSTLVSAPSSGPGLFTPELLTARGDRLRRGVVLVGLVISPPTLTRQRDAAEGRGGGSRR